MKYVGNISAATHAENIRYFRPFTAYQEKHLLSWLVDDSFVRKEFAFFAMEQTPTSDLRRTLNEDFCKTGWSQF